MNLARFSNEQCSIELLQMLVLDGRPSDRLLMFGAFFDACGTPLASKNAPNISNRSDGLPSSTSICRSSIEHCSFENLARFITHLANAHHLGRSMRSCQVYSYPN